MTHRLPFGFAESMPQQFGELRCAAEMHVDVVCYDGCLSSAGEPTETDYTAVGCAITTISSNLTEMSKGVKLLAALMDDEVGSGHKLMGAARMLAGAVSDLLRSVEPAATEVRSLLITVGMFLVCFGFYL